MKLNKKGKEELRNLIVEQLKERIPNGPKIHLDRDLLECLLFETEVSKDKQRIAKFLVWSGPFLSKIDLSEISFDDVVWNLQECETESYGLLENNYYQDITSIDLSYTNANINFTTSYRMKQFGYEILDGVQLEGTDLSNSGGYCIQEFRSSNLKNTNIAVQLCFNPNDLEDQTNSSIYDTNFENVDLSHIEVPIWYFSEYLEEHGIYGSNFANTGLKIATDKKAEDKTDIQSGLYKVGELVKAGSLTHCYIDDTIILSEEEKSEKRIQKLNEYQAFKESLFISTIASIEHQTRKVKTYYQ